MPKGVEADQLANSGTANKTSANLTSNAGNIYGSLAPTLAAEAAAPPGYTAPQKAAMNTAGQQSAGGSAAGAVGQGALLASRTKNAGTADTAIADSVRSSGKQASDVAVGTEVKNANLQQQQRQNALQGEESLYSTTLGGGLTALGLSNSALSGASNSGGMNNPWNQYGMQYLKNAGAVAAAAAGA